ncbi:MAG: MarR family transcriptional regulator [Kangiellaceae bacterium]|nr:MarR family transcriptional regulator [Kangiellaceae bacterium]
MKGDLIDQLISEWVEERVDLDTSGMAIVGRIIRLGHLMSSSASEVLKPHGLSYTEFDILATLRRKGSPYRLTPTQLSKTTLLTSGAMTAALNRLEKKELISRQHSDTDLRSRSVTLDKKGILLIEVAAVDRFEEASSWTTAISKETQFKFAKLLKSLG